MHVPVLLLQLTLTSVSLRRTSPAPRKELVPAALVAAIGLAGGGVWLWRARETHSAAQVGTRLLIAPFENLTGESRFDNIGRIAADRIAANVAQVGSIEVVPSNMVLMALRDTMGGQAERLSRLSTTTHAGMIVSGTVVRRGDSLALQAQVTDVRTGKIAITLDASTGSVADPIPAVDALGDHLLGALGIRQIAVLPRGFRAP